MQSQKGLHIAVMAFFIFFVSASILMALAR